MEALFLLIPLSLLAVLVAIILFFRMSGSGQFDDDQGPAFSILLDDDRPPQPDVDEPQDTLATPPETSINATTHDRSDDC